MRERNMLRLFGNNRIGRELPHTDDDLHQRCDD
jgi:hypothetical protein